MAICLIQESNDPVLRSMWKSMMQDVERDADILSANHTLQMQKVADERYAYIIDVTAIQTEMAVNCHLTMLELRFMPLRYSLGFQNNTAYKDIANEE